MVGTMRYWVHVTYMHRTEVKGWGKMIDAEDHHDVLKRAKELFENPLWDMEKYGMRSWDAVKEITILKRG